ncbi:MAG: hypothetical protein ACKPKO_31290, partial [Candidatus Fonsibacter sp.]
VTSSGAITNMLLEDAPQAVVEAELNDWERIWKGPDNRGPSLGPPLWSSPRSSTHLGPIDLETFRRICRSFRWHTGLGVDSWNPRVWALLQDQTLQCIIDFLYEVEKAGVWPTQTRLTLYFEAKKLDGGASVMGLLPGIVRAWEAARTPMM